MRAVTKARERRATATTTNNLFTALTLVSDFDSQIDSVYSTPYLPETYSDSSVVNHEEYQARILEDRLLLEDQLGYIRQIESNDDDWDDKEDTMIITLVALKALCSNTLPPLTEYDTVQIQQVRQSIINGLIRVTCETHNHGHRFILVTQDHFQERTGKPNAVLLKTPKRPAQALATTNYKKFIWELKLYTTYMKIECATVHLLKKILPNNLVGLEVMYRQLPPNFKKLECITVCHQKNARRQSIPDLNPSKKQTNMCRQRVIPDSNPSEQYVCCQRMVVPILKTTTPAHNITPSSFIAKVVLLSIEVVYQTDPEYHLVSQYPYYHDNERTDRHIEHKIPLLFIVTEWIWRYTNNITYTMQLLIQVSQLTFIQLNIRVNNTTYLQNQSMLVVPTKLSWCHLPRI